VHGRDVAASAAVAALVLAGCAGARIEGGVFHSPKGYRLALPGHEWSARLRGAADLELRHHQEPAAMLVNASCDDRLPETTLDVLTRHLLVGLGHRALLSREDVTVDGRVAQHSLLAGRSGDGTPVQVEAYVVRDGRCVYDFLYAAPPPSFGAWRADFGRLVATFTRE
jgi:hypothetical protein